MRGAVVVARIKPCTRPRGFLVAQTTPGHVIVRHVVAAYSRPARVIRQRTCISLATVEVRRAI